MFNKELYNLTLTSDIANKFFPNIHGECYGGDNSFLATLRALLAPRMKEDEHIALRVRVRNDRETTIKGYTDDDGAVYLSDGVDYNTLLVCGLNGTENSITASFQKIENSFLKTHKGFEELKDLHVFVAKQANVRFYINEETKSTAIFVGALNTRIWHLIQSLISRFVPWFFKDNPLNDEEKALVKALTNRYAPEYENLIEKFAAKYDFRGIKIQQMLGGFENRSKNKQLTAIRNDINNQQRRAENLMNDYTNLLQTIADLRIKECGLEYQIKEGGEDSEIVDYFVCNKHLNPISVSNDNLEIIVSATIENYDPDLYERMYKNPKSYLFTGYEVGAEVFKDLEVRKKFINAIFGEDSVLKIKVCAYYNLNLQGRVSTIKRYTYPPEYIDHLTNPHFYFFACIGNNEGYINKLLREGDYIAAIEQCVSSAKNLNLSEGSQTVAPFLGKVFEAGCKSIIKLPDGTSCTPTEAYKWLVSQEENNNTQEVTK